MGNRSQKPASKMLDVEEDEATYNSEDDSSSDDDNHSGSDQDGLTKKYGNVTILLIKDEMKNIKVDVIINSTSSTLDLSQGAASRGLLEAAGDSIQKECKNKYPTGISGTDIAQTKGGNLGCQFVYHVSLQKWKGDENKQTLEDLVYKCLETASAGGMKSIAIPALGTGLLSYDRDLVARCMFKNVKRFSRSHSDTSLVDVRFVIYPSDTNTYDAFKRRLQKLDPMEEDEVPKQRNTRTLPIRIRERLSIQERRLMRDQLRQQRLDHYLKTQQPRLREVTSNDIKEGVIQSRRAGNIDVKLAIGQLTKQSCDGVMTTCTRKLDLSNGTLSKSVLEAAGPGLQTECSNKYPQGIQHGEIAVLSPGNMSCKKIYCGALPRFDKPVEGSLTAKQILSKLVTDTLKQASSHGLTSVCFPTLGTGHLKYPSDASASLMFTAIKQFADNNKSSSITSVIIVVHSAPATVNTLLQPYKTKLLEILPNESKPKPPPRAARGTSAKVRSKLSKEDITKISHVRPKSAGVPLPGLVNLESALEVGDILQEKSEDSEEAEEVTFEISTAEELCVDGAMALPARNTPEFCLHMYTEEICPPSYWTHFTNKNSVKKWLVNIQGQQGYKLVDVSPSTFKSIRKLVDGTWLQTKVGQGRDALGLENLGFTKINVTKIQRIENLKLYEKYRQKQQNMFHKAGEGPMFKKLSALGAKYGDPKTENHLDDSLKDTIYEEVNEGLFFHGTKDKNVEGVIKEGIDPRLAQGQAVFGKAIYMAESSTKADQYADERGDDNRRKENLKMFLVRCSLGDIFLTKQPRKYCRPPCCVSDCARDDCSHDNRFDCIVEEEKYIFREFVVYEGSQAYPEYLITYDRV